MAGDVGPARRAWAGAAIPAGAGKLASIEDGRAIVRFGSQHETFVKMLDRNGKKELVRDGLSKVLGQPVGVMFEVESEPEPVPAGDA